MAALVLLGRWRRQPSVLAIVLLQLSAAVSAWSQVAETGEDPPVAEEAASSDEVPAEKPKRGKVERVEVAAEAGGGTEGPLGATSTILDPGDQSGLPSTVTDLVTAVPGVSENGQGGLFQVFSIRGVARQRVLSLASGMRIVDERRAGTTFTFIDPLLLEEVEVLQGPASTFYGSGALGGVVEAFPRSFDGWAAQIGYDSNADENFQILGSGGDGWSVGIARRDAGLGEAADGTILNSRFTQYSAVMRFDWGEGPRRYEVLFIPTYGKDIGKSSTDFPDRTTNYPLDRHQMLKFSVESESGWRTHAYVHAHDLETEVTEADQESQVFNDSLDYGLRWETESEIAERTVLRWGGEAIGRAGVDAEEVQRDLVGGSTDRFVSLDGADELEAGAFGSLRHEWSRFQLEGGARLSGQRQKNDDDGVSESAVDGYIGAVLPLGRRFELGGRVASGVRFPSLGERFFVGTTGRGSVVGNPDLSVERALTGEASVRWLGRWLLIRGAAFRTDVDDYIERVEIAEDVLTFVNITEGTIQGLEFDGTARPTDRWTVSFGGHRMNGRDADDRPLGDVPPDELFAGVEHARDRWAAGLRWAHRADKDDPGSAEKPIPSADLLSAHLSFRVASDWRLDVGGHNLLNEEYLRAADRKAPLAAGRSLSLRLAWRGD